MKESTHPNGGSITENPSRQKSFVAFASSLRSELTDTEACCYRHVFTNSTMFKNHQNCLILQFYNRATTFAYSQLSKGAVVIRPKVDMSVTRPSTVRNKT